MAYIKEIKAGLEAVLKASKLCRQIQKNINETGKLEKEDLSPVTIADFASQALIIADLMNEFPDDQFVGEESAGILQKNIGLSETVLSYLKGYVEGLSVYGLWEIIDRGNRAFDPLKRFWTIDPIDGTKGFLRGDQYAIALSLLEEGEVRLGILGCPELRPGRRYLGLQTGCILWAEKGEGASIIGFEKKESRPVSRPGAVPIQKARLCESFEASHSAHEVHENILSILKIEKTPLRMDSQAKYAALALGKGEIYLRVPRKKEYREKIWDHAAGSIILKEAGGDVTDLEGKPLNFSKGRTLKDNFGIVASIGKIHQKVLGAVSRVIRKSSKV